VEYQYGTVVFVLKEGREFDMRVSGSNVYVAKIAAFSFGEGTNQDPSSSEADFEHHKYTTKWTVMMTMMLIILTANRIIRSGVQVESTAVISNAIDLDVWNSKLSLSSFSVAAGRFALLIAGGMDNLCPRDEQRGLPFCTRTLS
jgi:hypothetical protein